MHKYIALKHYLSTSILLLFTALVSTQNSLAQSTPEAVGASNLSDGSTGVTANAPETLYDPDSLPMDDRGLPLLSSLPGATLKMYFSFDGYENASGDRKLEFDTDGDPSSIGEDERALIYKTWLLTANLYSFLDVDVTTIKPNDGEPTSWILVSNSVGAGYSFTELNTGYPTAFLGKTMIPHSTVHEIGHNFGLRHQADFDLFGRRTARYTEGDSNLETSIMGNETGRSQRFTYGRSLGAIFTQDDLAIIQARMLDLQDEETGGDGFRKDDHSPDAAFATLLEADNLGTTHSAFGIIERRTDIDSFKYTATSEASAIRAIPRHRSSVHLQLHVYDSHGNLISSDERFEHYAETSIQTTPGQEYTIKVSSHGDYGELGVYKISAFDMPELFNLSDLHEAINYHKPTEIAERATASLNRVTNQLTLTSAADLSNINRKVDDWTFAHRTLHGNGSITVKIDQVDTKPGSAVAQAGIAIRESNARGAKFIAIATSDYSSSQDPPLKKHRIYSRSEDGTDYLSRGYDGDQEFNKLRLTRLGNQFTVERFSEELGWITLTTTPIEIHMQEEVQIGIYYASAGPAPNGEPSYAAIFSDIEIEDGNPGSANFTPPSGLQTSNPTADSVSLNWNSVPDSTGYRIMLSTNNVVWNTAGFTDNLTLNYQVTGLEPDRLYFFKVSALYDDEESLGSLTHTSTRPGAVTDLTIAGVGPKDIVLLWTEVNGESGYNIQYSVDGATWSDVATIGAQANHYHIERADPNDRFLYRVQTLDEAGVSEASQPLVRPDYLLPINSLTLIEGTAPTLSVENLVGGRQYQLQKSTDLTNWIPVGRPMTASSTGENHFRDRDSIFTWDIPRLFYRLSEEIE